MPDWLSDASANRHIKTYVKDFLDVSGNLTVRNNNEEYKWNSYGQLLSGNYESDGYVFFGIGVSMDVSGLTIVVGASQQDGANTGSTADGAVTVYRYDTNAEIWYQLGNLITGESNNVNFGWNVDINDAGNRIMAIDPNSNFVNVYDYNSGTNTWDKQVNITAHGIHYYGGRISGDGNTIVFNNYSDNSSTGKQYVYRNTSETTWTQIGEFTGSHTLVYAGISPALSYDGNRITFAEPDYNFDADGNSVPRIGRIAIYDYDGTTWNQVGDHIYGDNTEDRSSGVADLSKDGSILAVASDYFSFVKVYQYDATVTGSWKQLGTKIQLPSNAVEEGAGVRLSDDGTVLVVAQNGDDTAGTNSGALYIYKYIDNDWVQRGSTLYGYTGAVLSYKYGTGIAMSGDGTKIAAGGLYADLNATNSGYVQAWQWSTKTYEPLIDISGETIIFGKDMHKDDPNYYKVVELGDGTASYGNKLELYGGSSTEYFGSSLAMNEDGYIMIVGAPVGDESGADDGYATVFKWANCRWATVGKLISPSSTSSYRTGATVDINDVGNIVLVGALAQDASTGGSISAYEFINGDWSLKGSEIIGSSNDRFGHEGSAINGTGNIIAGMDIVGNVKVYQYVEGNSDWSQLGSNISVSSGEANSGYGATKRIDLNQDGTIIAVGDVYDDTTGTNNGRLSVYKFTGDVSDGSWNLIGNHITITTSTSFAQNDEFGREVSINSDGTIVAATSIYYNNEEGRTFIYKYSEDAGDWAQLGTDIGNRQMVDSTTTYNARSVALSGDGKTVTIGDSHDGTLYTYGGAINVLKYANGDWVWVGKIYGSQTGCYLRSSCISRDGKRFAGGTNSDDSMGSNSGLVIAGEIVNYLDGAAMKIEHDRVHVPKLSMGDWTTTPISMSDGDLTTPMMTLTGLPANERDYKIEWGLGGNEGFNTGLWAPAMKNGRAHASYFYLDDNQYEEHDLLFRGFESYNGSFGHYFREGYALVSRYLGDAMYFQTSSMDQNQSIPNKHLSLGIGVPPGWYKLNVSGNAYSSSGWTGSDDRLKHNEIVITNGLETIRKLAPRHYFKTRKMYDADHNFDLDASGNPLDASGNALPATAYSIETGFIAQEVKEISELAHTFQEGQDGQPHGIQYASIFVHAIKALQELDEKVQQRQAIITSLEEKIQTLENA